MGQNVLEDDQNAMLDSQKHEKMHDKFYRDKIIDLLNTRYAITQCTSSIIEQEIILSIRFSVGRIIYQFKRVRKSLPNCAC